MEKARAYEILGVKNPETKRETEVEKAYAILKANTEEKGKDKKEYSEETKKLIKKIKSYETYNINTKHNTHSIDCNDIYPTKRKGSSKKNLKRIIKLLQEVFQDEEVTSPMNAFIWETNEKTKVVDFTNIIPLQETVAKEILIKMAKGTYHKEYSKIADLPRVIEFEDGDWVIDGTHRSSFAIISGKMKEKCHVVRYKDLVRKYAADKLEENKQIEKAIKGHKDTSKLIKKVVINKDGKRQTVWVKTNKDGSTKVIKREEAVKEPKKPREKQWYDELKEKYQLSAVPSQYVKEKDVEKNEDFTKNPWCLRWKEPNKDKYSYAYPEAILKANSDTKWARLQEIKPIHMKTLRDLTRKKILEEGVDEKTKKYCAIINIMTTTGLRVGDFHNFQKLGNRGTMTLLPSDIEIDGDKVLFNFTGKMTKQNLSVIEDPVMAEYLAELKEERKDKQFLFFDKPSRDDLMKFYRDTLGFKKFKLHDLRTYKANEVMVSKLHSSELPPPPRGKTKERLKKQLLTKIKWANKIVAIQLNDREATVAQNYINPKIINNFIVEYGLEPADIRKAMEVKETPTLDSIIQSMPKTKTKSPKTDYDSKDVLIDLDVMPLPEELVDEYKEIILDIDDLTPEQEDETLQFFRDHKETMLEEEVKKLSERIGVDYEDLKIVLLNLYESETE